MVLIAVLSRKRRRHISRSYYKVDLSHRKHCLPSLYSTTGNGLYLESLSQGMNHGGNNFYGLIAKQGSKTHERVMLEPWPEPSRLL